MERVERVERVERLKGSRASVVAILLLGGVAAFSACAQATGTVSGGDVLFDAAPAPSPCDIDGDSGSGSTGAGTTWTDLYRDYFGPTGKASCAGDGACHGDPNQSGAKGSGGYVCGPDKDVCRNTMFSSELVIVPDQSAAPDKSGLIVELRRRLADGTITGLMPKRPQCVFEQTALDRIEAWIKNGAPND